MIGLIRSRLLTQNVMPANVSEVYPLGLSYLQ
jgi:hypothetical protein